jgi:hypothetical protein
MSASLTAAERQEILEQLGVVFVPLAAASDSRSSAAPTRWWWRMFAFA